MLLALTRLIDSLDANQVEYVIIGGVAAIAHGSATLTFDLDLCYARYDANLQLLVNALAPFRPRLRGAEADLPFKFDAITLHNGLNFTLTTDAGDLDLLGEVSGIGTFQEVIANSEEVEVYGHRRRVIRLDALIRAKKAAGRPKDLIAAIELEALLALKYRKSKIENHKS